MKGEVIIACDFSSKEATLNFLDQFKDVKPFVKIGMELYYAEGPEMKVFDTSQLAVHIVWINTTA